MSDFILLTNDEVLEHHGILGQKWGIRRYQNADGSLTEKGKKRQKLKDEDKYDTKDTFKNAAKVGAGTALTGSGIFGLKALAAGLGTTYGGGVTTLASLPFTTLAAVADGYSLGTAVAPLLAAGGLASMPVAGLALGVAGTAGLVGTGAAMVNRYFKRHSESNTEKK